MRSFFERQESITSTDVPGQPPISKRMRRFLRYKKEKKWGYIVFLATFLITVFIALLALISKSTLYAVLFNEDYTIKPYAIVIILIMDFWVFSFNAALFYGLKLNNPILIFLWIVTMMINWNVYVFARLINLVSKAAEEKSDVGDLYGNICHLFPVVGIWLLMISIIWDYWQTISSITDIPELIDFLMQRHARAHDSQVIAEGSSIAGGSDYVTGTKMRYIQKNR